jgi:carboxypeptidase family protein
MFQPPYRFLQLLLSVMVVMAVTTIAGHGQTDQGRITGTITDATGALVPGAVVTVKNMRTGEERTTNGGSDGGFVIAALRPSVYTLTVTAKDFAPYTLNEAEVNVGQALVLHVKLGAAAVTAMVDITAAGEAATDTASASMSATVNLREVEGLPINGRQLSQLYLQAPGSVNSGSGTFGDIRFSGRAVEQNIVRYDGIEGTAIIDASPGNLNGEVPSPFRLQSSLENIQEFRIDSNNYPAEYGTGTGGQINVVTKSGSNSFHGSGFEYFRNDALDASNFFDNIIGKKSPLRLNQFGGSVGGPIIKNRLFFFGSYEGYRLRAGVNSIETVPGQASRICASPIGTGSVACNTNILPLLTAFRAPGVAVLRIGPDLFDTVQLQSTARVNENAAALRLDYKLNGSNSMYFRFFRDQGSSLQPEGVTGRVVQFTANPQNGVFAWQSILKPTLLNELKIGFNGAYSRTNGIAPTVNGIDLSALSINVSGTVAGFALPGQGTNAGTAAPGGLVRASSATNGRGQPYTPYSLSFIDNVNWTKGSHNLKFGGEFRAIRLYTDRQGGTTYTFANINSFLLNQPQSIQYLGDVSAPSPFNGGATGQRKAEQEYYIAYVQDEWKLRPNLTLNYGLRYEYYTPLREARNLQILFDINSGTLRDPSSAAFQTSKTNFGPRLALTWSPNPAGDGFFGGGRTLLRGGFGVYYGPGQTEDQIQPIESDRISSTLTSGPLLVFNPDQTAAINAIIANFNNNPNNRAFQPRAYASEYKVPERVYSYSFSLQQELLYNVVATFGYVGSQGRNLFLRSVANNILPGQTLIQNGTNIPSGFGVVNRCSVALLNGQCPGQVIGVNTVREFSILSGTSVQNPFAEVDFKTSGGADRYDALQVLLSRRFNTGLTLRGQYTFGRSFGTTAGSNEARTAANNARDLSEWEYDRGYNNFDVRHTFNVSAIYTLPVGAGKQIDLGSFGNALLGGWDIGAIINARSGLPLEIGIVRPDVVIQCVNSSGCVVPTGSGGATTTLAQGFVAQLPGTVSAASPLPPGFIAVVNTPRGGASRNVRRPDFVAGVDPYLNGDRLVLNPAAFTAPLPGTFGNVPRNTLRGPNFRQADLILTRRFRFTETTNLEFRTEVFNVFNFANFDIPASRLNLALPNITFNSATNVFSIGSGAQPGQPYSGSTAGGTFGLLRQTVERTVGLGTSRQIQFALRLNF